MTACSTGERAARPTGRLSFGPLPPACVLSCLCCSPALYIAVCHAWPGSTPPATQPLATPCWVPACRPRRSACLLLHGVTQLASLLAWSSLPGNERFQRVLSIIVCLGLFLMPCVAPSWYIRRRQAVLVAFRWAQVGVWRVLVWVGAQHQMPAAALPSRCSTHVPTVLIVPGRRPATSSLPCSWHTSCRQQAPPSIPCKLMWAPSACKLPQPLCCPGPSAACRFVFFAFPLLRKARGIQKVLDDAPQPGARGLVKDMLKLAWGEAAGFVRRGRCARGCRGPCTVHHMLRPLRCCCKYAPCAAALALTPRLLPAPTPPVWRAGSRLMAVVMATMLNPLPLLPLVPHLLLQVYSVAMVRWCMLSCARPSCLCPQLSACPCGCRASLLDALPAGAAWQHALACLSLPMWLLPAECARRPSQVRANCSICMVFDPCASANQLPIVEFHASHAPPPPAAGTRQLLNLCGAYVDPPFDEAAHSLVP